MKTTLLAVALGTLGFVSGANAQIASDVIPAEFPPASYTGNQYVDSNGCAFIRAGISGSVNWVPRVNRQRQQLCGFQPTFAQAPEPDAPATTASAPIIEIPAPPAGSAVEAPVVAAAPAPVPAAATAPIETVASLPAPSAVRPVTTPVAVPTARVIAPAPTVAAPAIRRVTLAEICAEIAATGQTVINQATGQPVNCAPTNRVSGIAAFFGTQVPASNPVPAPVPAAPAPGYQAVFDDGRVNPQRGIPAANAPTPTVSTMSAPQVASGHRFVQVGTFGNAGNAERTAARLRAAGLPVSFANTTRNGQALRIVAAGPFSSGSEVQRALQVARSMGFSDAYSRR